MAFKEEGSVNYTIINGKKVPVVKCETEVVLRNTRTNQEYNSDQEAEEDIKNPTTTAAETVYTVPSNARAIVQNIQLTNESGSKVAKVSVTDSSATTDYQIAYADITGPTICNVAKGPVVLEENDVLKIESSVTSGISGIVSILEINRE